MVEIRPYVDRGRSLEGRVEAREVDCVLSVHGETDLLIQC